MKKPLSRIRLLTLVAMFLLLTTVGCERLQQFSTAKADSKADPKIDPNRYYAVLLSNGSVYFGKLQGLSEPYTVLREVYYVQSSVNQETKQTNNVLIRRGKELHGPDEMWINEKSIIMIEPVGSQSKVAQLIEESKKNVP